MASAEGRLRRFGLRRHWHQRGSDAVIVNQFAAQIPLVEDHPSRDNCDHQVNRSRTGQEADELDTQSP